METTEPRADRPSRLRRALTLAAGAVVVAVALSGCIKLDMALTVTPENTVDGTIVFAVDKQLLTLGGGNPEDAFKDAAGDAPFPTAPSGGSVTTEVYDQDGKYGQKFIFTGVPLTEFDDEDLSITRQGDFFVVDGTLDLSDTSGATGESSDAPLPLPSALTAGFEVSVSMTFPGEVVEHNGTLEGTTVTWVPKAGEKLVMSAKAKATGGSAGLLGLSSSSSSTPLLIGLVIAALLLVGGLVALLLRRGRTPAAAGAVGAAMPDTSAVPGFAPAPSSPADPSWAPPPMPGAAPPPPTPPAPAPPAPEPTVDAAATPDQSAWAPPPVLPPEAPAPPVHDTLVVPEEAPTQAVAPEPAAPTGTPEPGTPDEPGPRAPSPPA
jgi:hypothetical protein